MAPLRHPFLVLVLALAVGWSASTMLTKGNDKIGAQVTSFPDVDPWTLEGKATIYLREAGILSGFDDGLFHGDLPFTRAQTAKMFLLAATKPLYNVRNAGVFSDVYDNQWYARYVMSAAINEMISGYPDGTFRPDNTVNTAEFLKLVSTTFNTVTFMPHSYMDVGSTDWFNRYAGLAKNYDLFPDRQFDLLEPARPLTRKEAAIGIYQYLIHRDDSLLSSASSEQQLGVTSSSSLSENVLLPSSSSAMSIVQGSSSESSSSAIFIPSSLSSSSLSLQSEVCYFPPAPPSGCYYVCEQNERCLKQEQCTLQCASSSASSMP